MGPPSRALPLLIWGPQRGGWDAGFLPLLADLLVLRLESQSRNRTTEAWETWPVGRRGRLEPCQVHCWGCRWCLTLRCPSLESKWVKLMDERHAHSGGAGLLEVGHRLQGWSFSGPVDCCPIARASIVKDKLKILTFMQNIFNFKCWSHFSKAYTWIFFNKYIGIFFFGNL